MSNMHVSHAFGDRGSGAYASLALCMVQAAEEAAALEARRLKEEEEYAAWKGEMAVEGGGSAAAEAEEESAGLLGAFEAYIKVCTCVWALVFCRSSFDDTHNDDKIASPGSMIACTPPACMCRPHNDINDTRSASWWCWRIWRPASPSRPRRSSGECPCSSACWFACSI